MNPRKVGSDTGDCGVVDVLAPTTDRFVLLPAVNVAGGQADRL